MSGSGNLSVLVAPLDWGLGHATRCIPIIKALNERQIRVIIAAEGAQKALLLKEFPDLAFVQLDGYRIRYSRFGKAMLASLLLQVPAIFGRIRKEQAWLRRFCEENPVDAVISDNRYGLHHADIHSIMITHQLFVQTGLGKRIDRLVLSWHYALLNKFSTCWVPDNPYPDNIAGALSNPPLPPALRVRHLGILSRFKTATEESPTNPLLIMLSGPEPQRTVFENKVLKQLKQYKGKAILLRGLPGTTAIPFAPAPEITVYNHLPAELLEEIMQRSALVIARSGYSTVMDIFRTGRKAVLVATPGQPEQEYLSTYLAGKKWILSVSQQNFDLNDCIRQASSFPFQYPAPGAPLAFEEVIDDFIGGLRLHRGFLDFQKAGKI